MYAVSLMQISIKYTKEEMFSEVVWKNACWKQGEQLYSKTKENSAKCLKWRCETVNEILHWVDWQELGILKSTKKDECTS